MTGVEFRSLVTVRLSGQLYDLDTENLGDLAEDAHAIERKATGFDLRDPAHGAVDRCRQLRLIPAETAPRSCYALPCGQFSHHGFPSTLRRYPRRTDALSVKVTAGARTALWQARVTDFSTSSSARASAGWPLGFGPSAPSAPGPSPGPRRVRARVENDNHADGPVGSETLGSHHGASLEDHGPNVVL